MRIAVVHGVHIWWCPIYYQPEFMCSRDKMFKEVVDFSEMVIKSDKTRDYKYGGDDAKNNKGDIPPKGTRWLSPRELARDFLKNIKK